MKRVHLPHNLPAFSLLELIVSMGIVGVVIAMLSNVLVNSIIVSQKSIARSFVREEITDISDRISNDIRDAVTIVECGGSMESARCVMETDSGTISWEACLPASAGNVQVCKKDSSGNTLFISSVNVVITAYSFEEGFDVGGNAVKKNVILTLVGDHANSAFTVSNILRQVSISTRNYILRSSVGEVSSITQPAPTISVDSSNIVYTTYTSGGVPMIVDNQLRLSSGTAITGASVAITGSFAAGTDHLTFVPTGAINGSYNATTGILTLTGNDSAANYQQVLRSVGYRAAQAPVGCSSSRQITFTLRNAGGSASASRSLSLSGSNYGAPSGAVAWYRADAGTNVSGGRVNQWLDQSSQANHLNAYTVGPLLVANGLNSKPVVRFDQVGTCGANPIIKLISTRNAPFFGDVGISQIALAHPAAGSGLFLSGFGNQVGTCWGFSFDRPNVPGYINYCLWNSLFGSGPSTTGPNIIFMGKNAGSMANTASQYVNGVNVPQTGGTSASPSFASTPLIVGEIFGGDATCYLWKGDLAETMLFNRNISAAERQEAEQYLAGKWWHDGFTPFFSRPTPSSSSCGAPPPVVTTSSGSQSSGPVDLGGVCTSYSGTASTTGAGSKTTTANLPAGTWTLDVSVFWGGTSGVTQGDNDDRWTISGSSISLAGAPVLTAGTQSFSVTSTGGTVSIASITGSSTPGGVGMCVSVVAK